MQLPGNSSCINCRWLMVDINEVKCKAYPKGIPEAILTGKHDHRKPYKGDNGITFTPIERAK